MDKKFKGRRRWGSIYLVVAFILLGGLVRAGWDWWASSPEVSDTDRTYAVAEETEADDVVFVAVQSALDLADYRDKAAFQRRIDAWMKEAVSGRDPSIPMLVAFPEDIGLPLVLLDEPETAGHIEGALDRDGLSSIMEGYVKRHLPSILTTRARFNTSWARSIWITQQEKIASTYIDTFSTAAKKYGVYVAAGSAPLQRLPIRNGEVEAYRVKRPEVYNTTYLFGPDGKVLLTQEKVHLLSIEGPDGLDLVAGSPEDLGTAQTPLGRIGIAICLDAFHPDVLDVLQKQGADVLVQPSANPAAWDEAQQLDWLNGSWKAVVEEQRFKYAVNPMAVGALYDLKFEGQSSILARDIQSEAHDPSALAGYKDVGTRPGFLAVASTADNEDIVKVRVSR